MVVLKVSKRALLEASLRTLRKQSENMLDVVAQFFQRTVKKNLNKLGAVLGDDIAERKMIFELFFDPISSADVGFYLNQVFYFVISFNFGSDLSRWWRRSSVSDVKERPTFKKITMINDGGGHYEDCSLRLCW